MTALARGFSTFFYTGYFPLAPATFATAVFLALYCFVPGGHWLAHPLVLVATTLLAIPASSRVEGDWGKDPSFVVIDEVVGIQIVLVGAVPTWIGIIAAFILFRVFDVLKPPPLNRLQALPGGWGIVIDDVLAGVYTRAVLALGSLATPHLGRFVG